MINIIPQSEVRLLKTPLEKDEEHTLAWDTLQEQSAYMLSNVQKTYSDFTYVRDTQTIVVPDNYDTIYTCNYLMYKNNGFNNKYFYAFITKMEYVSENSTRIYFEIDSLQTWYFQINYNNVFIEREHVSDDTVGANTVPENVEMGDYIDQSVTAEEQNTFNFLSNKPYVFVSCTQTKIQAIDSGVGRQYNGIYSGLINICFPTPADAELFMLYLDTKFSDTPVVSVSYAPRELCMSNPNDWQTYTWDSHTFTYHCIDETYSAGLINVSSLSKTNYLDANYVPRNNKLLTYPFKYFVIDNNVGECYDYKYEMFSSENCTFAIHGALSVGCSIKLSPQYYNKKDGINYLYSMNASKLPTCAWINDAYTNYLTANAINLGVTAGSEILSLGVNTFSGNALGMAGDAVNIASTIGQVYERSKTPLQAHNGMNQGDINFSANRSFNVYRKSIKEEYARIIDDYFTKYGYKVNRVKTPNINSRRNFNYIKTIGCNFTGDIPQEDMQKIKDLFNNGITFWHNAENFLNYSANNDII